MFSQSVLLVTGLLCGTTDIAAAASPNQNAVGSKKNAGTVSAAKSPDGINNAASLDRAKRTKTNAPLSKTDLLKDGKPSKAGEMFMKGWASNSTVIANQQAAIKFYQDGLKIDPGSASCNLGMADISHSRDETEQANRYLDAAIERDPDYSEALVRRAFRYQFEDDYKKAIKDYSRVIQLNSKDAKNYAWRGLAYYDSGDIQRAREDLVVAHKLAPTSKETLLLKAELEYYDCHYEWVIYNCDRLVLPFGNPRAYFLRSEAYMRLYDFKSAKRDLKFAEKDWKNLNWYSEDLEGYEYDHLHAETDPTKRFALACSAPMFEFNRKGFESLPGLEPSMKQSAVELSRLMKWWRILNKSDLERTISTLTKGEMHHPVWMQLWRSYKRNPEKVEALERGSTRLALVKQYGDKFGERGSLAFDLGRVISLCRWGYVAGYFNEEEAYRLMIPAAVRIQQNYKSWDDYIESYFVGRQFWNPDSYSSEPARVDRVQHTLRMNPNGLRKIPWDTKLVAPQKQSTGWTWPWEAK